MTEQRPGLSRTIAGWPLRQVAAVLLLVVLTCWAIWATRTLIAVRDRRIVSVSLSALVQDFVEQEARVPESGQPSAERTRLYLLALDRAIADEGRNGTVVLAAEATLGRSVPDRTVAIRRRLAASEEGAHVAN